MRSYNSKTERFVMSIFSERLRELRKEKGLTQKQAIQNKLNKLNPTTIEKHANVDVKTIRVWSEYVLELLELDRRYQDVVYNFCVSIDNCIRYLVSYTDELAKYGFSLPQIMVKVRDLGTFHWLNKQSKAQLLGCI
ncbi:MAG: hypothetical protein WAU93_01985 [Lactococcus raffinolactis]